VSRRREPYQVLVVEDHRVVAEGLVALLEDHPDLHVLGWVATVAEAVQIAAEKRVDVAVVDYWLPDGRGADAAEGLRAHQPDAAVVFLSADSSEEAMLAALESGASGYLVKTASGADVASAVRRAADGEMLLPARQLTTLLARRRRLAQQDAERSRQLDRLTAREREVLDLMAEGMDNRDIAKRLGINYTTVRTHVRSVLDKLDARTKLEAVVKASRWGLPPSDR
jgi:two-component system, NarL family, nitrate/nitrite response regulator NarL